MFRHYLKITAFVLTVCFFGLSLGAFEDNVFESQVWSKAPQAIAKQPNRTYRQKVLDARPVGYWRLGEAQGPIAVDETRHQRHGTYRGKPRFGDRGAIALDPDTAIRFDGKPSYVEVPANNAFSQPTSRKGMTVEVWMRPDAVDFAGETNDPYVFWLGKGSAGQHEWAFRFYTKKSSRPNRISAYVVNKAGGLGAGAFVEEPVRVGEWMHIVATFDPGNKTNPKAGVSLYKNGVLRGGPSNQKGALYSSFNIVPAVGTAPLRIGTRDFGSFLTGALDDVAIYPRVLTAAEIADHYRSGSAKVK
ncbi:MAG: LamG domain-containing protein [Planctomycetes bacterium]|nr:LamG domain-containing protein [Planctomycetota bacterium]